MHLILSITRKGMRFCFGSILTSWRIRPAISRIAKNKSKMQFAMKHQKRVTNALTPHTARIAAKVARTTSQAATREIKNS